MKVTYQDFFCLLSVYLRTVQIKSASVLPNIVLHNFQVSVFDLSKWQLCKMKREQKIIHDKSPFW